MPVSRLSISAEDGRVQGIEIDLETETLENLQALVEVEFGIFLADQAILCEGRHLIGGPGQGVENASKKLKDLGVLPDALLLVARKGGAANAGAGGAARRGGVRAPPAGGFRIGGLGNAAKRAKASVKAPDPAVWSSLTWGDVSLDIGGETLYRILQVNEGMLSEIEHSDPQFYAAAKEPTPEKMKSLVLERVMKRGLEQANKLAQRIQAEKRLQENPYDVEAQKVLEEMIAEKNVEENWQNAMEHMPEAFASVYMLYINAHINGTHVKVFVDSGAQTTILSKGCAERCGIMRLVDTKYAGTAVGVGSAKIIGKVHMAPLKIGDHHFPCSFTVLDNEGVECELLKPSLGIQLAALIGVPRRYAAKY
jgi:DNA damage-inducible protein 1